MVRAGRSLCVLSLVLLLVGAQVHASSQPISGSFAPSELHPQTSERSGHDAGRHLCGVCIAGIAAILSALPTLDFASKVSTRAIRSPKVSSRISPPELNSPRAPPQA
jgi:hypothetical protein